MVIDAAVDVALHSKAAASLYKAFDKIKDIPENAFKRIIKTVKQRCGGILEKIEHDNNIQEKLRYDPEKLLNFSKI